MTEGECFFILSFRRTPCATFPTGEGFLLYGHLSVSQSGAFSDCVTRFRGGALRHAKFPKTSYKVQLLDTRLHGRCVGKNSGRGRGLIFLSEKVLVPLGKTRAFCRARVIPHTPFFVILLCVICARLLKGRWLFVGLACCHSAGVHRRSLLHRVQGRP